MKFKYSTHISRPSKRYNQESWDFVRDLHLQFPQFESNDEIVKELVLRGLLKDNVEVDPEFSCTYLYFSTKGAAQTFIHNLNEQPEIKNYEFPVAVKMIQMQSAEWDRLKTYLKSVMSTKAYVGLQNLDIKLYPVDEMQYISASEVVKTTEAKA